MFTPAASAAGSLSRIDAQARPGLPGDVEQGEHEHERADDDHVAVVRRVADGHRGSPDGLEARQVDQGGAPGEAVTAVREVDGGEQ